MPLYPFWTAKIPEKLTGIGYKPRYFDDLMHLDHSLGWVEVHAENYMMDGGPTKAELVEVAKRFPVACHGVGLSIGSMGRLDKKHLKRLKILNQWLKPSIFSEHLAWSTHSNNYLNDLLPVPYTRKVLGVVVDHIAEVQDTLGRQMLLENPSTYLSFADHEMDETAFINQVIANSGCGLLLDVNNVYVTATNQNLDAQDYINQMPLDSVGELHLSGHSVDRDADGRELLIDSHDAPIDAGVWELYNHTISRLGAAPTLIEWDSNFPDWQVLEGQAVRAQKVMDAVLSKHKEAGCVAG